MPLCWRNFVVAALLVGACDGAALAAAPATAAKVREAVEAPEPELAWTLQHVELLARRNNPTLAQAAARIDAARGEWVQAGLYPNPNIGYAGSDIGMAGKAGMQGAYISQQVVTAHKLRWNRAVADAEILKLQQAFAAQERRVINDTRIRFYEALVAQRAVELTEKLVKVGTASQKVAEDLLKIREGARVEVLQAKIEANNARLAHVAALNQLDAAWRRLSAVIGIPATATAPLAGDLRGAGPTIVWEETLTRLETNSPEMSLAVANLQRAEAALCQQYAYRYPNYSFQGMLQHDHGTSDEVVGVQFSVPLQLFNRNQGNIARARAEVVEAEREIERVALSLRDRLAEAFRSYDTSRQQVELYDGEILPSAQESLDLTAQAYRAGELGYLSLLTAQRTYFQTNLERLEALRQLRTSQVEIDGLLLRGGLE